MAENKTRPAWAAKQQLIDQIAAKVKDAKGMAIAEYTNLTVDQMTELRKQALEAKVEVKVYKDSLVKRALDEDKFSALDEYLVHQNVFLFSNTDGIEPAKIVHNFAKKNPDLILKAGIYEGEVQNTEAISKLATLPSKDELYSMIANSLLYPLRQFMNVVSAVATKKEAEAK